MEEKCYGELKKLKHYLIESKILMNRRDDDWWLEKKRNNFEWMKREGMMLLLTKEIIDLVVDKHESDVLELFDDFFWTTSVSSREVQCSLVRLCKKVSDRMVKTQWNGHRVLCWVVGWMLERFHVRWTDDTVECLVNYLVKLLECDEMEIVKWAILMMEILWVKLQLGDEQRDKLCKAITRHTTLTETFTKALDLDLWNAEKYQVWWCARWCKDKLIEGNGGDIPEIKLSLDRSEARSDLNCSPVRSSFPTIKSNVYFYEAICVTNGNIKLGWTTRETRIDIFEGMDNDKYAIGLQIGDECSIQHNDQRHHIPVPLSSINVVGCLLDLDNRRFEFYLNGKALECPIPPGLSPQPYFATALLSTHQQCHFNFGQSPFKYPPPNNNRFTTFDGQCGGDTKKYRLVETENWGGDFWFKHTPVDHQVSLFFCDELQNEFNREVRILLGDIENDCDIGEWGLKDLDVDKGWRGLRYIQAFIEVLEKVDGRDNLDVMAQWAGKVIENIIDEVYKPKLLELIYPYLQLIPTESTFIQHRSICIVLLQLIKCCHHYSYCFMDPIHSSIFNYLTRTLTSTSDEWTQLFVLIALGVSEILDSEKREIESCVKIEKMVKRWGNQFEGKNVEQLLNSDSKSVHELRIQYQLYQCSTNLLTSSTPSIPNATLNPKDLSPRLNLSPCRLSARSDWHWQSVRSTSHVNAHIYYFEVILLTAGPMTIGWATKRTELARTEVGNDEFSLGFDGYNRWILHENNPLKIETIPRWKPGDVIGCLLNHTTRQFAFTLNGQSLPLPLNIYFSSMPYYACVSLSSHQQVYFNFGQTSFKYPPKRIDYLDFHQFSTFSSNQPNSSSSINFTNAQLTNVLISSNSTTQSESVILSNNTSANVAPISILPTECQLCRETPESTLLRFVCCDTLSFCRDCVDRIDDCPKCKKKIRRNAKRSHDDSN